MTDHAPLLAIVIPSRWQSSRFPGKPLALISGATLLARVVHLARSACSERDLIVVATDDIRIADHCSALKVKSVMTDPAITSGTGRALAAVEAMPEEISLVVNLQGDAPFLPAAAIRETVKALRRGQSAVTAVSPLKWDALDILREHKRHSPFSGTTCIRGETDEALWFSKQIIPAIRGEAHLRQRSEWSPVLRHLGLYGFTLDVLRRFEATGPSYYEQLEELEQLRLLAMGVRIHTVAVNYPLNMVGGVDTPQDLTMAEAMIADLGDPMAL